MMLDEAKARSILAAAHLAWSCGDLEGMLAFYNDDLTYFCNTGAPDGGPLELFGKADMRAFLEPVLQIAECTTVPITFSYKDGVGRAQIDVVLRHLKTGHTLTGLYRQVVKFAGDKICAVEEFHDAARMRAFWNMVLSPNDDAEPLPKRLPTVLIDQPTYP